MNVVCLWNISICPMGLFDYIEVYLIHVEDCTSLEKIILGSSLKQARCFNYQSCINVKEIHCKAITPPDCGFASDIYNDATLYVPKGCYEAYYTAVGWRNFKTIIEE